MAGERSARSASARSRAGTSSRKSTWRRQAETESRSSSGSFIPSSQRRPRRPKRSLGRRGQRLRARADLVLRAACGRAAAAPGGRRAGPAPLSPRPGSTPPRGNPRRAAWPGCGRRVYRSWPWRGDQLEPAGVGTTTQATSGSIIRAIYVAPIVGPSAWSSAPRLGAHSSSACGLVSTVPAERYLAALGDRTSQWSRWMSTPSEAHLPSSRR